MFRSAARFLIRTVGLLGLIAAIVAGSWFAVERMIVQAAGPHKDTVLIRISPGDGHAAIFVFPPDLHNWAGRKPDPANGFW